MATLGLIVKATRLCNLRCKYCFDWRSGPGQVMPFDVLLRTISGATRNPQTTAITFNWHGGEPTVLPMEFYQRALSLQRRFRRPSQRITNTIQTNATLLDGDWVRFLAHHGFAVGVSVDGPPEVHDAVRVDQGGHGTFDRVCNGIALLRQHRVPFAVIVVVDRPTVARGADTLLDFLTEYEIADVALNFVMPAPMAEAGSADLHYIDPPTTARFLMELWDARQAKGLTHIRIRELDAIQTSLSGHRPNPCTFAGACLGLVFRVEPDGDVYHCDYFGSDPAYRWGNILSTDFDDMRSAPTLKTAHRSESVERDALRSCPHYAVCRGWCPHQRRTARLHASQYDSRCCGLAEVIDHVSNQPAAVSTAQVIRDSALAGLLELA